MCVCVCEREREKKRVRERMCMRGCVCVRETGSVCVCVCERERERENACVCVCVRERGRYIFSTAEWVMIMHTELSQPYKEGRNWVLCHFQQLRSYRDEIETWNREEIPNSSRIVPRGLSVAERP